MPFFERDYESIIPKLFPREINRLQNGTLLSKHLNRTEQNHTKAPQQNILPHGHNNFFLALGYKAEVIKDYFLHYSNLNADFTIDLSNGGIESHQKDEIDWKVTLVQTGIDSMTGGRVKRMQKYVGNESFLLTYGDGVSNINIAELLKFHRSHGKMVTVSAVHPIARFGELEISRDKVKSFQEKPQTTQGWINGGYFVIEPEFFDLIEGDDIILEKGPLETAAKNGELMAYQHHGYWQCMDSLRDKEILEKEIHKIIEK